jgi:hypothetical protein
MNDEKAVAGYRAIADLYNALMTGTVLTLITRRGVDTAREFVFRHFRRQHLEKFLPGLRKLGLDQLPHAVACAQYHYFSNALGGVKTEYWAESDRKAWVRYPPPRWIWRGTAVCAVPDEVNAAMLHGWHGHNGVSLGNPRLGFVCTGMISSGAPGLEGYYYEYDQPLAPEERVRFVSEESMPRTDAGRLQKLDGADWPLSRREKVCRSYAMEYVRNLVPTLIELLDPKGMREELGRTARLIGLQVFEECATGLGLPLDRPSPAEFADFLTRLLEAQGEKVTLSKEDAEVVQQGWRLMGGIDFKNRENALAAFEALNELWAGALAAYDRFLVLETKCEPGTDWEIIWKVR